MLFKVTNTEWRILAAHTVRPNVGGSAGTQWAVQWYVIDPHLDEFYSLTTGDWQPSIVAAGRLDAGSADRYHPVIGVTAQGVAYIEYTHSSNTVWPEVRRVQLSNSYASVLPGSEATVQSGPATAYVGDRWVDFNDMQADPNDCKLWSVHTLVHNDDGIDPVSIDERDVWLFELPGNCSNANLNGDTQVNLYDITMFNDLFATGARRVDMDTDGDTDSTDAALYQAAYDDQSQ